MSTISWWRGPLVLFAAVSGLGGRDSRRPADAGRARLHGGAGGCRPWRRIDQRCASCHSPDLRGGNEAPQLAGANFMSAWRGRTTRELFEFIQTTMPPGAADLSAEQALSVTAFILQSNGGTPGAQALAPTTAAGRLAPSPRASRSGQAAAQRQQAAAAAGAGARQAPEPRQVLGRRGAGARRGLTVAGEVKNYVPVTDEMLRNPPPGDWLMARRNYQAWSYSPLNEITRANVKDLKLAWVWAMNETRREPDACRSCTTASCISSTPATSCRRSTRARAT